MSTPESHGWEQAFRCACDQGASTQSNLQFEAALSSWTNAVNLARTEDLKFQVLLSRSRCYTEYAKHLQAIPSASSERSARFALDPQQLAKLGLADADRAISLQHESAAAQACKGEALQTLENYNGAEAAFYAALSLDPDDAVSQAKVEELQQKTSARRGQVTRNVDDFDCTLCCKLLFRPVTTPCGHSFCAACFQRSMDHSNKCPICRRVLHTGSELPITVVLQNVIRHCFPEETATREAEARASSMQNDCERTTDLPLFVMSPMLPGEKIALNIFEPRYRLMVRRCLEGDRRLGMTCAVMTEDGEHTIPDVVTRATILDCQVQPDGRLSIDCLAQERLCYSRTWEQDGYRMCRVQSTVRDAPAELDHDGRKAFEELDERLAVLTLEVQKSLERAPASFRTSVLSFMGNSGDKPDWRVEPEKFTFFAAQLLSLSGLDKMELLMMRDSQERCKWVLRKLSTSSAKDVLSRAFHEGCCIM